MRKSKSIQVVPDKQATKICTLCCDDKPVDEFSRCRKVKSGRYAACKACYRARYYLPNADKKASYQRAYKEKNRERDKEKIRKYQIDNRLRLSRNRRAARHSNLDKTRAVRRRYRKKNRPEILVRNRASDAVYWAVKRGTLRVLPCQTCGLKPRKVSGRQRIEAHHWRGYAKEHQTDVQWFCKLHHAEADRVLRQSLAEESTP